MSDDSPIEVAGPVPNSLRDTSLLEASFEHEHSAPLHSEQTQSDDLTGSEGSQSSDSLSSPTFSPPAPETQSVIGEAKEFKLRFPVGKIEVTEPELRGGTFKKYHVYKVKCASLSFVDHVFRRYNDFVWLRTSLQQQFPGVFLPPLPPSKIIGNRDDAFVSERKNELSRFLNRVASIRFLAESEPFNLFLTRAKTFEEAQKDLTRKLEGMDTQTILHMYKGLFPDVVKLTLSDNAETEVSALREFLTNCEQKLIGLATTSRAVAESYATIVGEMAKMNTYLHQLYNEEKGYPDRPEPPRVDILEHFNHWHVASKQVNAVYHTELACTFRAELADLQAFLELLKHRQEQKKKSDDAAARSRKWQLTPPANDKQASQKAKDAEVERKETALTQMMTKLLLASEIKRYWRERMEEFRHSLSAFSKEQLNVAEQTTTTWRAVARLVSGELADE